MAFFEKIGQQIIGAEQGIAKSTKDFAEVTKLKSAVAGYEAEISKAFTALGKAYYEAHKEDEAAENQELMEKIKELYRQVAVSREQIKQIKGTRQCPGCGAEMPVNAVFCSTCGKKIEEESTKNSTENCPKCGVAINNDSVFCTNCGAKLKEE